MALHCLWNKESELRRFMLWHGSAFPASFSFSFSIHPPASVLHFWISPFVLSLVWNALPWFSICWNLWTFETPLTSLSLSEVEAPLGCHQSGSQSHLVLMFPYKSILLWPLTCVGQHGQGRAKVFVDGRGTKMIDPGEATWTSWMSPVFEMFKLIFQKSLSPRQLLRRANVDFFIKQENPCFALFPSFTY